MHILLTRPLEDARGLAADLEAMGHRVSVAPLLGIEPVAADLSLTGVQALIATSRNGIRAACGQPWFGTAVDVPLYAVGPATAAAGREAGFRTVIAGPAAATDLLPVLTQRLSPEAGAIVHLAGETLAFDLAGALRAAGFDVRVHTVYRAVGASALPVAVAGDLRSGAIDGVILMSPRTAKIFTNLAESAGLGAAAKDLCCFCLSEAVARGLDRLGPRRVEVARMPNSQEMLALIRRVAPDLD